LAVRCELNRRVRYFGLRPHPSVRKRAKPSEPKLDNLHHINKLDDFSRKRTHRNYHPSYQLLRGIIGPVFVKRVPICTPSDHRLVRRANNDVTSRFGRGVRDEAAISFIISYLSVRRHLAIADSGDRLAFASRRFGASNAPLEETANTRVWATRRFDRRRPNGSTPAGSDGQNAVDKRGTTADGFCGSPAHKATRLAGGVLSDSHLRL